MNKEIISKSIDDTVDIALEVLNKIDTKIRENRKDRAFVVSFLGDLGSGKTALIKKIASKLNIKEEVVSPTFTILKKYKIPIFEGDNNATHFTHLTPPIYSTNLSHLIHIDAYRIEKKEELLVIGWGQLVQNSKNLILIEWPEKVGDLIKPDITIKCQFVDDTTRIYTIEDEK